MHLRYQQYHNGVYAENGDFITQADGQTKLLDLARGNIVVNLDSINTDTTGLIGKDSALSYALAYLRILAQNQAIALYDSGLISSDSLAHLDSLGYIIFPPITSTPGNIYADTMALNDTLASDTDIIVIDTIKWQPQVDLRIGHKFGTSFKCSNYNLVYAITIPIIFPFDNQYVVFVDARSGAVSIEGNNMFNFIPEEKLDVQFIMEVTRLT